MTRKGQINLGMWVMITAIIAIIILLIFDSTIRSYILTNLESLTSGIAANTGGQFSEVMTNFTAYNCSTTSCSAFTNLIYEWTVNFNGQNYTAYLNGSIGTSSSPGNYSLEIYPVILQNGEDCSNASVSASKTKILRVPAGKDYNIYYFSC